MNEQLKKVMIKNHEISFYVKNNFAKTTILFIHGFNSSYEFVEPIFDMENTFNIIALNLPGSKYVEPTSELSVDLFNDVVEEFIIKYIKVKKIIILGHSLGGATAASLTHKIKKIKKVIFLCPIHPFVQNAISHSTLEKFLNPKTIVDKIKKPILNLGIQFNNKKKDKIIPFIDKESHYRPLVENYLLNENFLLNELDQNYKKIKKPIYILVGQHDLVIGTPELKKYALEVLNTPVYEIPLTGHNPIKEDPVQFSILLNRLFPFKRKIFNNKKIMKHV